MPVLPNRHSIALCSMITCREGTTGVQQENGRHTHTHTHTQTERDRDRERQRQRETEGKITG